MERFESQDAHGVKVGNPEGNLRRYGLFIQNAMDWSIFEALLCNKYAFGTAACTIASTAYAGFAPPSNCEPVAVTAAATTILAASQLPTKRRIDRAMETSVYEGMLQRQVSRL
jgi:hypothetical protein